MDWSNLISALIGALIGGAAAIVAESMTIRRTHQNAIEEEILFRQIDLLSDLYANLAQIAYFSPVQSNQGTSSETGKSIRSFLDFWLANRASYKILFNDVSFDELESVYREYAALYTSLGASETRETPIDPAQLNQLLADSKTKLEHILNNIDKQISPLVKNIDLKIGKK